MALFAVLALGATCVLAGAGPSRAAGDEPVIVRQNWTFGGISGYFDKAQLRRGYQVYRTSAQTATACGYSITAICRSLAALNIRLGKRCCYSRRRRRSPMGRTTMARCSHGPASPPIISFRHSQMRRLRPPQMAAATPPDLSVMAKAREVERADAWYIEPFHWLSDVVTTYQEQGPDYIHAMMTGYTEPPAGVKVLEGMNYNSAFPGAPDSHMPPPLSDGVVTL